MQMIKTCTLYASDFLIFILKFSQQGNKEFCYYPESLTNSPWGEFFSTQTQKSIVLTWNISIWSDFWLFFTLMRSKNSVMGSLWGNAAHVRPDLAKLISIVPSLLWSRLQLFSEDNDFKKISWKRSATDIRKILRCSLQTPSLSQSYFSYCLS